MEQIVDYAVMDWKSTDKWRIHGGQANAMPDPASRRYQYGNGMNGHEPPHTSMAGNRLKIETWDTQTAAMEGKVAYQSLRRRDDHTNVERVCFNEDNGLPMFANYGEMLHLKRGDGDDGSAVDPPKVRPEELERARLEREKREVTAHTTRASTLAIWDIRIAFFRSTLTPTPTDTPPRLQPQPRRGYKDDLHSTNIFFVDPLAMPNAPDVSTPQNYPKPVTRCQVHASITGERHVHTETCRPSDTPDSKYEYKNADEYMRGHRWSYSGEHPSYVKPSKEKPPPLSPDQRQKLADSAVPKDFQDQTSQTKVPSGLQVITPKVKIENFQEAYHRPHWDGTIHPPTGPPTLEDANRCDARYQPGWACSTATFHDIPRMPK